MTFIIKRIKINGHEVEYQRKGQGNPIVLLHGWGCDLHIFKGLIEELSKRFDVISLSFPGFGNSQEPKEIWGVNDYSIWFKNFVESLNIENPILIGHSFGGRISLVSATLFSVKKLILIGCAGIKPKRKLKYYIKIYLYKTIKKIIECSFSKLKAESILEKYRKKIGSSDYKNASPRMRSVLVKIVNEDLKFLLPRINVPVLLIWGENDTATPLEYAKIMEKKIPDAGLVVLKNASHYVFLERKTEFYIIVNQFLKSESKN